MNSLKIAVLTEIINYRSGARAPLEIAKQFCLRKHQVTVYAYTFHQEKQARSDLKHRGIEVVLLRPAALPYIGKWSAALTLYQKLRSVKPDVIHFSGTPPFFFAAKATGIPVVRNYQGTQFDAFFEMRSPGDTPTLLHSFCNILGNSYIYCMEFLLIHLSDGVVAISRYAAKEAQKYYRCTVDAITYDGTTPFSKVTVSSHRNHKNITLLSVSRITPYKGFHRLIALINRLNNPRIRLVIAGSAPHPAYLRLLNRIKQPNTQLILAPTDRRLAHLYASCDLYITADRYLFFGLPVVEAASFGKPALAFDYCAAREVIAHGKTGYVCRSDEEFLTYLKIFIDNQALRTTMGIRARQFVTTHFRWEKTAAEYEKVFKQIIKIRNE